MILDSIVDDKFIFKNKQIKMAVDAAEAPEEFFFLHIDYTPSSSLKISLLCASMLQTSCIVFIRQCHQQGFIDDLEKERLEKYILEDSVCRDITEQMKTFVTKSSHKDGECLSAYLREIVSKVGLYCSLNLFTIL